jgi:hypothetical protein
VTALAAALALVAALLFAVAMVAQHRAAAMVPDESARGLGLMRVLVRHRLWWYGTIGAGLGYVAHAAALGVGALLLVQPLMVTTLLFALPLGARWAGHQLRRSEWVWAVLLATSLALFVVLGHPTDGVDRAPLRDWLPAGAVVVGLFVIWVAAAARSRGAVRAAFLAAAAALCHGVTAAMTKGAVGQFDEGLLAVLTSWETYVLVIVAAGGALLQQSAFQAGALGTSLPTLIAGEPVVAVAIGMSVLQEELRADGAEMVLIGALAVVMVVATVTLARSSARAASGTLAA